MTKRARLGKMLIGAAVLLPALIIATLIAESHVFVIHVPQHQWTTWLAVDAAALLLGLMLNRGDDL